MRWAATAARSSFDADQARMLPVPWTKLSKVLRPKGGNTMVVLSAPGVGKTTFLLNWAAQSGARTLFCSADTSPQDTTVQLAAMATNQERKLVESRMLSSMAWRVEYATAIFHRYPNLVVDFSPRPSMEQIGDRAHALTELWGDTPQFIVMDTASNVAMADMSNNASWQGVWLSAIRLARQFNAVFCFAHHVKQGPARSGRLPPEMSDGLWGCDQFPEFVMGLWNPDPGQIKLIVRKNRTGVKDVPVAFDTDLATSRVDDRQEAQA